MCRVADSKERYNLKDNNIVIVGEIGEHDISHGVLRHEIDYFCNTLTYIHQNIIV